MPYNNTPGMNDDRQLRSRLIRLAGEKPHLRPHLLPLLRTAAQRPGLYTGFGDIGTLRVLTTQELTLLKVVGVLQRNALMGGPQLKLAKKLESYNLVELVPAADQPGTDLHRVRLTHSGEMILVSGDSYSGEPRVVTVQWLKREQWDTADWKRISD